MNDLKSSLNNLIAQLEEKFSTYTKLTSDSDKRAEREVIDNLILKMENEHSMFEKKLNTTKLGKKEHIEDAEYFEEKINSLRVNFAELKNDANKKLVQDIEVVSTPGIGAIESLNSRFLMNKIASGDSDIQKGKEKLENIRRGLIRINEEITSIEEEIEYQRDKLNIVKDKVADSHSIVKQSKKLMGKISDILYHDTLLKILIVFIFIAIVGIVVLTLTVKIRKGRLEGHVKDYSHLEKNIDYGDIDENMFLRFYETGDPHVFFPTMRHQ